MKYTTKQSDGSYRTIDTDNDSLFSLIVEGILSWPFGKKKVVKRGKKQTRKKV